MGAFERRLACLATTTSFRDDIGAKNAPPPQSMVFALDPIQCRVKWRNQG